MRSLLMIALLAMLVVAVLLAFRRSGPRITEIEHRREIDEDEDRNA